VRRGNVVDERKNEHHIPSHPLVIELPKGRYLPNFHQRPPAVEDPAKAPAVDHSRIKPVTSLSRQLVTGSLNEL
jgi:hypothetical protein